MEAASLCNARYDRGNDPDVQLQLCTMCAGIHTGAGRHLDGGEIATFGSLVQLATRQRRDLTCSGETMIAPCSDNDVREGDVTACFPDRPLLRARPAPSARKRQHLSPRQA